MTVVVKASQALQVTSIVDMTTVSVERFTGLNFYSFHGFEEYRESEYIATGFV